MAMRGLVQLLMIVASTGVVATALAGSDARQDNNAVLLQGVKPDKDRHALRDKVRLTYTVRNSGTCQITYTFSSSKLFDLWIKRGDTEVYRFSRGRSYLTVITTLKLQPNESKSFEATWDQKDSSGQQVGPGAYDVYAQLTPTGDRPLPVKTRLHVGDVAAAVAPATIGEAIANADILLNRVVEISATYRGWQPNAADPNVKNGPPVTRSDWAICDTTGCMYVNGKIELHPERDVGTKVVVTGKLKKTPKGQVYLLLQRAKIVKP
jgi:hypothetical protein